MARDERAKLPTYGAEVGLRIRRGRSMLPRWRTVAIAFAGLASSEAALSDTLLTEHQVPLAVAVEGANATIEGCAAQNYRVAVTVVDRAGNVKATMRGDGANPHLLEGALRKAYTAAMLRISTSQMGTIIERSPGAGALMMFDRMTPLGGGLPIRIGEEVVGGIGVAGVPVGGAGGAGDEGCAKIGLDQITSRLSR